MGYYTNYTLSMQGATAEEEEEIIAKLEEISGDNWDGGDGEYYTYGKWYESSSDLIELSKQYPEILFTLEGDGEEYNDFWKMYVQNGKKQETFGNIVYEDYDPEKMK